MTDGYLSIEHGQVSLGNQMVPGTLVSMNIDGTVRFDDAKVDNQSGTKKTPMGWDDSAISLEMMLQSDDSGNCYEKLSKLNSIFKGLDNKSNPKIYEIINAHTLSRGIDQVVFKALGSAETNEDDVILITLAFDEHNPPQIPAEVRASATKTQTPATDTASKEGEVADAVVTADTINPFDAGFKEGIT
ncbi:MAG: hypothetical protein GY710_12145 [Desulfobacteraceae bacterium]|nr:hypothetical protein [Desulfobacteraceae bacterium]